MERVISMLQFYNRALAHSTLESKTETRGKQGKASGGEAAQHAEHQRPDPSKHYLGKKGAIFNRRMEEFKGG